MNVKPIRSEADYDAAMKEIDRLLNVPEGSADAERLDVLSTLVWAYETQHHPVDPPDPIEAIKFRMEQQALTRKDLEALLGTRSRVSEVLGRVRPLSLAMIRALHSQLNIPADVLVSAYKLKTIANRAKVRRAARVRRVAVSR